MVLQKELLAILDRVAIDDLLVVLSVANMCTLPHYIVKQIMDARMELGLNRPECDSFPDKHVKRIHRALDSDDVELVRMLLREALALAKLLFPIEAKVAMDIAQVDETSEYPLVSIENLACKQGANVDLNEAPFKIQEEHLNRMRALSKTVELGKRFFPRCSAVINKIIDTGDLSWLGTVGDDTPEEQLRKKQRHTEVEEEMTEAYTQDRGD
ncbi:hypothetical protein ACJRO7_002333 [Eucalyptus globulus]|uniref:NPR1/NIM1-like C-terminal domain-containing protein n=1 Tax=Eucalyptus globulus TaxID=34317 RepID=A0ABD3LU34_EUCGL